MIAMYSEQLGELILDDQVVPVPDEIRDGGTTLEEKTNLVRVWAQATGILSVGITVGVIESEPAHGMVA